MARAAVRIGDSGDAAAARALLHRDGAELVDSPADADLLVVDEWTAEHDPVVTAARARGARISTLAESIVAMAHGPVVAITGTAGKSSTAHALCHLLRSAGLAVRAGHGAPSANAWPDATIADRPTHEDEVLVAELTSTHLCHMAMPRPADVAVITLLRPDHHDLHPSMDAYFAAKRSLLSGQGSDSAVVLPADDPETLAVLGPCEAQAWGFGRAPAARPGAWLGPSGDVTLVDATGSPTACGPLPQAPTQRRAVLAAAAAAMALGVPAERLAPLLAGVPAVAHRQNVAGRFRDAVIIDDTMAATPRKALEAVEALAGSAPVLVLGGDENPHDDAEVDAALQRIGALGLRVVAFGPQAGRVAGQVPALATAPTVMGALATAATIAGPDGTVLVSPMFTMSPAERDRVAALPEP